jgi:anti-sigma factor RsiW
MSMRDPDDLELELNAYLDGELDPMRALEMEKRLAASPELARRHTSLANLRASLRGALAEERPSDLLRPRIERAIGRERRGDRSAWRALAASFVLGAGLAGAVTWSVLDRSRTAEELVAGHIRAQLAAQPIDVASSDRHTVKPWLAAKVAQSPEVFDLASDGFPLVGGRIDVVAGEPVGTTVYRRRQHLVSITALRSGLPVADRRLAGYRMRSWSEGGLTYVAVSDVPDEELADFERAFRRAARQPR